MMKCIIFAAGGREAAMAQKLAERFTMYAYIPHENPTIISAVESTGGRYFVDKTYNIDKIRRFIRENSIDLCVVNNDDLLAKGVADVAREEGLMTFGPTRQGAMVEWDKAYATKIIENVAPESIVRTDVVYFREELVKAVEKRKGANFVIKPNGLTGGKGVKVGGVHFKTKAEGLDYAQRCMDVDGCVIIQDIMVGHEFTVMGFTNGHDLILAPCTYDYPYRFDGDTGPGTGGMGVVSYQDGLLPFLTKGDIEKCKSIMQDTIDYINKESVEFNGVLNAGFFKTNEGIFFMEFNARIGDPEALNVMNLLETPFADVALAIAKGDKLNNSVCSFKKEASYLVYIVSKDYAVNPSSLPMKFDIPNDILTNSDVYCYAANIELNKDGQYSSVGNSRLFAIVKTGRDLKEIKSQVDSLIGKYISKNCGLDFRTDIGTQGLQKVFILGNSAGSIQLAKKLIEEGYTVHLMAEGRNPDLFGTSILYHDTFLDLEIIKRERPDFIITSSEKYILNKDVNDLLYQELSEISRLCFPKFEYTFLETDKVKVREILDMPRLVKICSIDELRLYVDKNGTAFVRAILGDSTKFIICSSDKVEEVGCELFGGGYEVFVDSYFYGENIKFTYYVNDGAVTILTPVLDYPYYMTDEGEFIKTSGVMCEYSCLKNSELNLWALAERVRKDIILNVPFDYNGFLAVQILYNKATNKYYFVEFDVRFGEPEFINIVKSLSCRFDDVLYNTNETYIAKAKDTVSLSVAIKSKEDKINPKLLLPKYSKLVGNSGLEFYYGNAGIVSDECVQIRSGGRLGFVFTEAFSQGELMDKLLQYKKENLKIIRDNGLEMMLIDKDSKKLLE